MILSFALPGTAAEKPQESGELLNSQHVLMAFVNTYCTPSSSKLITALCKEALAKIHEISRLTGRQEPALSFYKSLAVSRRFSKLLPYTYYYLGEFSDSRQKEQYLLKALKASDTGGDRQFALSRLRDYYRAEKIDSLELAYLLKLIEVQKTDRNSAGLEASYIALGEFYRKKRDYLAALDYYFEALGYSSKKEKNSGGSIYLNIAEVFRILNRKELAKMYIEKALDYTARAADQDLEVKALCAYSRLFYEDEDYPEALRLIDLAVQKEYYGGTYICAISSLYQKARILLKMEAPAQAGEPGHPPEAVALLKTAVDMGLKMKKYDGLLPIMCEYIELMIASRNFPEAKAYLEKIDDIYATYYPYYYFHDYYMALYFQKQEQMDRALEYYQKTGTDLERFFSGLEDQQYYLYARRTADIYAGIIEFYLEMYNRTENHTYIKKALYFSEIKNSYIYELNTLKNKSYSHFIEEKTRLEQEFMQWNRKYLRLLKNNNPRERRHLLEYESRLDTLKRRNEELREFILESPITYKKYSFKEFDLSAIQERLNARQMIVKYTVLKENIYAFCIDYRSTGYWKLSGSRRSIINKVKQLTAPLDDFTAGGVDYLRINYDLRLAHQLYEILVKDTWAFRSNIGELFIIPDDELFKLPFEALVTGFNRKAQDPDTIFSEYASADYLIEKLPVSYFFSLFHFREKREESKPKPYFLAAFGNPVITPRPGELEKKRGTSTSTRTDLAEGKGNDAVSATDITAADLNPALFKEIPSTQREIRAIASLLNPNQTRVFLGEAFNRENFEAYAPQAKILHIATHFINNVHYPQYSALLFSPGGDGRPFYYAHELFNLKLGCDLVVLSACESSEKHLLGLQGLRGMTASFKQAEARAVLVSLWPVDEHSSELTSLFYGEYQNNPQNSAIPTALRAAKLKLMNRTAPLENGLKISYAHPFLWANYILYRFK